MKIKKGECDKGEYFDYQLNKCVNNGCKRFTEYYSLRMRKCVRKSTCKINQIFNVNTEKHEDKKCKRVL